MKVGRIEWWTPLSPGDGRQKCFMLPVPRADQSAQLVDILGNTGVHLHRVENVRLVGVEELDRRIGECGAGIIEILDSFRDLGVPLRSGAATRRYVDG